MRLQERVTLFQDRLQSLIDESGMNRSSFARSISVDRSTLSQLLSPDNVRLPRADTIAAIAEVHQVSIDWLLGLTQTGSLGNTKLAESFRVDDYSSTILDNTVQWHREASGYKVRYVPTTLPDLLKTEAVAAYENNRYGSGLVAQSVRDQMLNLLQERHPGSELETCMSVQHLEDFATGSGIWNRLPAADRLAQLQQMRDLNDALYPAFRWYLYDGKDTYSASFNIFGPVRAVLFLGHLYIVINSVEEIRKLINRFDELIKGAIVHPHEIPSFLDELMTQCQDTA